MAELSPGQRSLAVVDLCQGHYKGIYVSRCSAFLGLGNGKRHQISHHTSALGLFDPDAHSSLCCPVTRGHPEHGGAGVAEALGAVLISSNRHYSPGHGASMLTR